MTPAPNREHRFSEAEHRRAALRQLVLPSLGGIVLVLVGLAIILLLRSAVQVALIADLMFTICVLLPLLLLCVVPVMFGLLAAIVGLRNVHRGIAAGLRRIEQLSLTMNTQSEGAQDVTAQKLALLATYFEPIDRLLSVFDRPDTDGQEETDEQANPEPNP